MGFVDHGFSGFGLKVVDVGYSVGHYGWHAMVVTLVVGGELGLLGFWVGFGCSSFGCVAQVLV